MSTRTGSSTLNGRTSRQLENSSDPSTHERHDTGAEEPQSNAEDKATKERNAAFLVEKFDAETHDAAELVADNPSEADEIAQHDYQRQREKDPLENVPTPHSPDDGPVERVQGHMQKKVLHRKS